MSVHQNFRHLLEAVEANAVTLTELRVDTGGLMRETWSTNEVRTLITTAPSLSLLEAAIMLCHDRQLARAMLRNEPPFQALRVRRLLFWCFTPGVENAFFSDLSCHASLEDVSLWRLLLGTVAAMGALVDACIKIRLSKLILSVCDVVPAVLPELTRLIAAGAIRELSVYNANTEMFDEAHESTRLFVAAVRASPLTKLQLDNLGGAPANVVEAAAFINTRQQ